MSEGQSFRADVGFLRGHFPIGDTMFADNGRLFRMTDAGVPKFVSNTLAWEEARIGIVAADLTVTEMAVIRGYVHGQFVGPITIPVNELEKRPWHRELSELCLVAPGAVNQGHFRMAAQINGIAQGIRRERHFAFTGWHAVGERHVFLHVGGGLGADGNDASIVCDLPPTLKHYALPDVPARAELKRAFNQLLRFLDLAPRRIVATLLASVPRALFGEFRPQDAGILIVGITGVFKSELQALILGFFGAGFNRLTIPLNFGSTVNFNEAMAFRLKNVVAGYDDYTDEGGSGQVDRSQAQLARFSRAIGNSAGRGRTDTKGNPIEAPSPRCLAIMSAETSGRELSAMARLLTVIMNRGDVDTGVLSELQQARDDGALACLTSAAIQYIAGHWDEVRDLFLATHRKYQERYRTMHMGHARIPEMVASFTAAAIVWVEVFHQMGICSELERERLVRYFELGILETGQAQADTLHDADPIDNLLDLVRSAVSSGRAHLSDRETGGEPLGAMRYGWRPRLLRGPSLIRQDEYAAEPRGDRIGWVDPESGSVYLEPLTTLRVASEVGRAINIHVNMTQRGLGSRLADRSLLRTTDPGRSTARIVAGSSRVRVFHLRLEDVFPEAEHVSGEMLPLRGEVA